ncbi:MAG: sensor histidine kinase [Saprospiraceae bacterium]|nr:sensor histidine kinase [Saprospiraceae bacterium]
MAIKKSFILCFAMAALPLAAQQSQLDSLYAIFTKEKTDSAKLEVAFAIIEALDMNQAKEQKQWLDTTEAMANRKAGTRQGVLWEHHRAQWRFSLGDVENAYHIAMDCAAKFREMGDSTEASQSLHLAGTSLSEFNPKAAIGVMQEAVDIAKAIKNDNLLAIGLTNLGYALDMADMGQTDQDRTTLEAALEVCIKLDNLEGILTNNYNLVEFYCSQRQFGKARERIAEMEQFLTGSEDEESLVFPIVSEGNVLMAEGKLEAALPMIEQGFNTVKRLGIWDGQWELYPVLIDLYKRTGRYQQAFEFLENYETMQDSMISLEKSKTVQSLQTRYETEKKEAQIAVQQADLARSRKEKWALAGGLALLGGLSVLFWRQRRKTQAANLELAASNEQIQQKNQKLDLLMRELHHRVKNNLQLVSSLLRLQSRQVGDGAASAAIKAGQLRVEAMSLIHQRLYREEGITLVNMQEFTQDLVEKIAFAFGHRLEEMDLQIHFQPTDLDVDKAMPMSLIINELLTNSFKYAFMETARPGLKIGLEQQGEKLRFHYADNGPGLPENAIGTGSFGTKLIASLSGQLGGQARQWNEGGARFELVF